MKNKKLITVITILVIITCAFYTITCASDIIPGDNARGAIGEDEAVGNQEGEPVVTNQNGEDGIENEDEHNHETQESIEIHQDDLYVASTESNYVMDQMVDGNVFITGRNVTITGKINGSLFVFTDKLVIEEGAWVACHVFACAGETIVKGEVADMYTLSGNLQVTDTAQISRDIKATAKNISFSGIVGRNVNLCAQDIKVPAEEGKLSIYGNLTYESSKEIQNLDKANINGETKYIQTNVEFKETKMDIALDYIMSAVRTVVFDVLLFIGLIFLAPKFIKKTKEYVSSRGILAFAIGIAFTVLLPIIALILVMINVGAGLALFGLLAYFTIFMLNACIVTITTSEYIASKIGIAEDNLKKGLLLIPVSLVIWGLRNLPIIGDWISILVFLCGIGIILIYQFDKRKSE